MGEPCLLTGPVGLVLNLACLGRALEQWGGTPHLIQESHMAAGQADEGNP